MSNTHLIVVVFAASTLVSACHVKQKAVAGQAPVTQVVGEPTPLIDSVKMEPCLPCQTHNDSFFKKQFKNHSIRYNWANIKAKIDFRSPQQNFAFVANIKIRRDSVILMSIQKFGIEGARVQISPDKVQIINRQHNEYLERPFSWINEAFGVAVSYHQLENLIIGNAFYEERQPIGVALDSCRHILTAMLPDGLQHTAVLSDMDFRPLIMEFKNRMGSFSQQLLNYQSYQQYSVSLKRNVTIEMPGSTSQADVEVTKFELNIPQRIEYSVPPDYRRL